MSKKMMGAAAIALAVVLSACQSGPTIDQAEAEQIVEDCFVRNGVVPDNIEVTLNGNAVETIAVVVPPDQSDEFDVQLELCRQELENRIAGR